MPEVYRNGMDLPDNGAIVPTTLPAVLMAVGVTPTKPLGIGIATVVPAIPLAVDGVQMNP